MSTAIPAGRPAGTRAPGDQALFTHRQIVVILIALMSGMFLAALDQTIVATSIRTIADDLNGLSLQAWATTAYLITSTISTPLYGKLSDLYGRRPYFIAAISIFVVGSVLCRLRAVDVPARRVPRLPGHRRRRPLLARARRSSATSSPPRERARYQGYFLAVFGTSSVLGPVVGRLPRRAGDDPGHRRLALGLPRQRADRHRLAARSSSRDPAPAAHPPRAPDRLAGARLRWSSALVPLLIVAEQGRELGLDARGRRCTCYVIGVVGIVLFLLAERRIGDDALLPLRLFRGRTFSRRLDAELRRRHGHVRRAGRPAALPADRQGLHARPQAGLLLLPMVIGIMAARSRRASSSPAPAATSLVPARSGSSLLVVAMLLLRTIDVDTPIAAVDAIAFVFGLGLGFNMQTAHARDPERGAAAGHGRRDVVGDVLPADGRHARHGGLPVGAVQRACPARSRRRFRAPRRPRSSSPRCATRPCSANPANAPVLGDAQAVEAARARRPALNDSSFINHLDPRLARPFLVGFSDSINMVFLLGAAVIAVAFVIVWFLPEEKLRTQSGLQAQQTQARRRRRRGPRSPTGPSTPAAPPRWSRVPARPTPRRRARPSTGGTGSWSPTAITPPRSATAITPPRPATATTRRGRPWSPRARAPRRSRSRPTADRHDTGAPGGHAAGGSCVSRATSGAKVRL